MFRCIHHVIITHNYTQLTTMHAAAAAARCDMREIMPVLKNINNAHASICLPIFLRQYFTSPPVGVRRIAITVSVCPSLCLFICPLA